ncbi:MAG: DNA (cytosine-5-)-methyltransferase [Cytophagia bacterium]|jgi:DNA (cytosine-5)-methyltransferase 1|nr:MAG: DNA (cytosine-5-)-methyltransferase [Cytophagales bacterium]TAG22810.1 MAG: DNA (cytosine-5-)-methyltransferase [Cytophagales bacterium]TAG40578.1 MAG: DNA (cytosine-5-)-methyltransferase [Cytophagia bacterium]TAG83622.1 MAG: DNA (cytosine-5-)-methyltransferase [Cytophagales bacterium]
MEAFKNINKIISLFSGAGGMDIGFEMAGFETVVAVEYDISCCDTLRKNRPQLPIIHGDISKITTAEILRVGGLKPTEAAVVVGGPPCQSFSLAGKRMGMNDPRGKLVLEFIRVVKESLPKVFVMENVRGMVNWQDGKAIEAIMSEISEPIYFEGTEYMYKVKKAILNAADYGVPQYRERVFIIGNRLNKNFEFPEPTHTDLRGETLNIFGHNKQKIRTVGDAISNLPKADAPSETALRVSETIKERIIKHGY